MPTLNPDLARGGVLEPSLQEGVLPGTTAICSLAGASPGIRVDPVKWEDQHSLLAVLIQKFQFFIVHIKHPYWLSRIRKFVLV